MRNILLVSGVSVLFVGILMLWACNSGIGNEVQTESPDLNRQVVALGDIKPLDDPANPYRNDYEPWDQWAYENMVVFQEGLDDEVFRSYFMGKQEGETVGYSLVDEQGCLLPYLEQVRLQQDAKDSGDDQDIYDNPGVLSVGVMDADVKALMCAEADRIRAARFMSIPEWLVSNPPVAAFMMPNGDVITEGPLGSGDPEDTSVERGGGCCGASRAEAVTHYRYNSSGELLRTTNNNVLFGLYWEGDDWPPAGMIEQRADFYYIFWGDIETNEIIAVYDFDATLMEGTEAPPKRSNHRCSRLDAAKIIRLYETQQELGI